MAQQAQPAIESVEGERPAREGAATAAEPAERRRAPRRRLRDRIASLDTTTNPALHDGSGQLANLKLLVEDDLRQTALTLGAIERYLTDAMALIENPALTPAALEAHATDEEVLDRAEVLVENLANLRRRMESIARFMSSSPRG